MRTKVIATTKDERRESCWTLIQLDDRTLHVEQRALYADGERKQRVVPINDFLRENGPPPRWLQSIVDRMFVDGCDARAEPPEAADL